LIPPRNVVHFKPGMKMKMEVRKTTEEGKKDELESTKTD